MAELLAESRGALLLEDIALRFTARGPWKERLPVVLDTVVLDMRSAVGRATPDAGGARWSG